MIELFLYLGKSSLCLGVLLLFFVIFLQKETFFKLNRWILLANIMVALTLPLLDAPFGFSNFEMIKIEDAATNTVEAAIPLQAEPIHPTTHMEPDITYNWGPIMVLIFFLVGFLFFLLRFLAQIFSIFLLERTKRKYLIYLSQENYRSFLFF